MALVQKKKGGPYTKNEKTKRQNEVYRLHFERGYSAVKISDMMKRKLCLQDYQLCLE